MPKTYKVRVPGYQLHTIKGSARVGLRVVCIRNGATADGTTFQAGERGRILKYDHWVPEGVDDDSALASLLIASERGNVYVDPNPLRWRILMPDGGAWWFCRTDLVFARTFKEAAQFYEFKTTMSLDVVKVVGAETPPRASMDDLFTGARSGLTVRVSELFGRWDPDDGPMIVDGR